MLANGFKSSFSYFSAIKQRFNDIPFKSSQITLDNSL